MKSTGEDVGTQNVLQKTWLSVLEQAAREVFQIMLGCRLEGPMPPPATESFEFTSMVGLAGELCGVLTLRCSAKSAMRITSIMLGTEITRPDEQMWDAVGELCNVIAGNFKNKIPGVADRCMLSVPTVITGTNYNYYSLADAACLKLTFGFEGEIVSVSLEVHS